MQVFAERIRERARELGLSDAEVARRAGLSERRYGYYATAEGKPPAQSPRDRVLARISVATDQLSVAELELAACQIECLTAHGPGRRRQVRGKAATG
jgi:transcriptional regulator with XRE-family HTH domain